VIRIDPGADLIAGQDAYRRGRIEEIAQQFEKAVDLYTQAVRFDPGNDLAFLHRGMCSLRLGRVDQALSDANQSLAIQPNSAQAYAFRGRAYLLTKAYDQAFADLREAELRDPKNPDLVITRAGAEEERGNFKAAADLYERALNLRSESVEILVKSGRALRQANEMSRAVDQCGRAIALVPTSADGYVCRAESLIRTGALPGAVDDLNQAFHLQPTLPQVASLLPVVREMIQINEEIAKMNAAQNSIAKSVPVDAQVPPRAAPEPISLPQIAASQAPPVVTAKPAAAPENVPSAIPEPKASQEALRYGRKCIEKGSYQDAVVTLGKAIELDPSSAVAYNSRGYAYLRTRQYDLAIRDFSKAISINSAYANAYWNRSAARRLCGDVPGSRKDIEFATRLGYPGNVTASSR
jgi:tetratricopeptide (TPR) repeat protein